MSPIATAGMVLCLLCSGADPGGASPSMTRLLERGKAYGLQTSLVNWKRPELVLAYSFPVALIPTLNLTGSLNVGAGFNPGAETSGLSAALKFKSELRFDARLVKGTTLGASLAWDDLKGPDQLLGSNYRMQAVLGYRF